MVWSAPPLHPSIFHTHSIWQVTLQTMLYEIIMHHTLHFPHTQHMAGDALNHALSHTAPLHLTYTQNMAGGVLRAVSSVSWQKSEGFGDS